MGEDEPEPTVYETEVYSEDEMTEVQPPEADEEAISMETALECFVTVGKETTAEARIKRIAREIAELRAEVGQDKVSHLEDAFRDLCIAPAVPVVHSEQKNEELPDESAAIQSQEFAAIEKRIADLEKRFGTSLAQNSFNAQPPILVTVESMRQKLALLTARPEQLDAVAAKLVKIQQSIGSHPQGITEQDLLIIRRLHDRLESLEPLIRELPAVIHRLRTLRGVHSEMVDRMNNYRQEEHTLAAMRHDISEWVSTLSRIETMLDTQLA